MSFARTLFAAALLMGAYEFADAAVPVAPDDSLWVAQVGQAKPTSAAVAFCVEHPAECRIDLSEPEQVVMTPALWRLLARVNTQVNRQITAVTDQVHWGVADRWDFAEDGKGDCEDIQLVKRRRLVKAGLPHRAMRMTVVIDENGEGHAVLTVRTDRGDYILDNRTPQILAWNMTGYQFVKREGSKDSSWVSLNSEIPVRVGMK